MVDTHSKNSIPILIKPIKCKMFVTADDFCDLMDF